MSIFRRALKAEYKNTYPSQTSWYDWYTGGERTMAGINVGHDTALGLLAIYAAVRLISEDVAKLPMITYRSSADGRSKDRARDHPVYRLLHDAPNPEMTALDFKQAMTGQYLLRGNSFAEIERNRGGKILALWPLRADRIKRWRYPSNGKLVYVYSLPNGEYALIDREDIFHLRGFSSDGGWGYNPVELAREELAGMKASRDWANHFYANDATPGGVLKHPGELSDTARENIERSWNDAHQGLTASHRIAILEEGVEWEQVGMKPEDAQWVETQRFHTEQAARMFRLAPTKLSDYSRATFSNIEETNIDHVTSTIDTHLVRWDQQGTKDLVEEGLFCEHLRDALLRGRILDRYRAYAIAINWGFMNPNEAREKENWNPIPAEFGDGDTYLRPVNMGPQDAEELLLSDGQSESDQGNGNRNGNGRGEESQRAALMKILQLKGG